MVSNAGSMSAGPNSMDNRTVTMGSSHALHGSTGNSAGSQGHSVGHPGSRSGGYNTVQVSTSSNTGYGPMGSADQVSD